MTMTKRTKEAKKNAGVAVMAMKLAKDKDDMQWKKANKFKKLFVAAKKAVLLKYGVRAKQEWMKKQNTSTAPEKKSDKK